MSKFLEVILVIVVPLAYGLAVSGFFNWLHRRRSGAGAGAGAAKGNGSGGSGGEVAK